MPVKEQTIGPSGCVSNAKQLKSKNANWHNSTNAKWQLLNKLNSNFLSWCVVSNKNGKMSKMQNDSLSTNPLIWGCPLKIRFHWREHFEWPSLVQNSIYLKRPFQILGNQVSYLGKAPMGFHIRSIFWRREILLEFHRTPLFGVEKFHSPSSKTMENQENQKVRPRCANTQRNKFPTNAKNISAQR